MNDETLDTKAVAGFLHSSVQYAQQLISRGELPAFEVGRGYVVLKSHLIAWAAERSLNEQRLRQEKARMAEATPRPIRKKGRPRKIDVAEMLL